MRSTTTLLLLLFLFSGSYLYAQTCTERLQAAQTLYDDGQIHDLVDAFQSTWGSCLSEESQEFSTEERVQAYRLLTLTYLQLDEPEKADEYMLKLLDTDPEYLINPSVDPTEFINLFKTFRTNPIFRIGARFGPNMLFSHMQTRDNTIANPEFPSTQKPAIGFQAGASMEFDLFRNKPILEKLILNPEIMYSSKVVQDRYEEDWRTGTYVGKFSSINLNILGHYNLVRTRTLKLHGTFGFNTEYRLSVNNIITDGEVLAAEEKIESRTFDDVDAYKSFDFGITAGASLRLKVGRPWFTFDLRYNYNFIQAVKENKNNPSPIITYGGFMRNNQLFEYITANAGIQFPIFKHEKLID